MQCFRRPDGCSVAALVNSTLWHTSGQRHSPDVGVWVRACTHTPKQDTQTGRARPTPPVTPPVCPSAGQRCQLFWFAASVHQAPSRRLRRWACLLPVLATQPPSWIIERERNSARCAERRYLTVCVFKKKKKRKKREKRKKEFCEVNFCPSTALRSVTFSKAWLSGSMLRLFLKCFVSWYVAWQLWTNWLLATFGKLRKMYTRWPLY